MGVFRNFPYSNFHEMNMDEIIKIIKNMLEEWSTYHAEWDHWMDEMKDDWSNYQEVMNEAWQNMQDFINNYFDNLDVQEEINNKIVSMIQTGEFGLLVNEYIPPAVNAWLNLNITEPTGVIIDTSLTVAGACADAKATGDAVNNIKSILGDYINLEYTANKAIIANGVYDTVGYKMSNYIDVTMFNKVYLYAYLTVNTLQCAFFDKDKRILNRPDSGKYSYTSDDGTAQGGNYYEFNLDVPENAVYFAFTIANAGEANSKIELNGFIPKTTSRFNNLEDAVDEQLSQVKIYSEYLLSKTNIIDNGNILDYTTTNESGYISNDNGSVIASESLYHTDYIELSPNTKYYIGGLYTPEFYAFYTKDSDGYHFVSSDTTGSIQITSTEQTKGYFTTDERLLYLRASVFSASNTNRYVSQKDEYNSLKTDFTEYIKIPSVLKGKKVLVLGDSISDNRYHTVGIPEWNKWASYLAEKTGFILTNDSMHATGYLCYTNNDVNTALVNRVTDHTDSEEYDLIVIFVGVNDFKENFPFGTSADTDKDEYVNAAMKYVLTYLTDTFTTARICAFLPLQYMGKDTIHDGGNMAQYVSKMREIYDEYSVTTLDLFNHGGFRAWIPAFNNEFGMLADNGQGVTVHDGLHPNQDWDNNYLAPMALNFLESLFM